MHTEPHFPGVLRWASVETRIGPVYLAYRALRPCFLSLDAEAIFCAWVRGQGVMAKVPDAAPPKPLCIALHAAIDHGEPYEGPVDLPTLTPFQNRVLQATRTIPCGQTRTYGEIAAMIGHPRAARAVGTALANNPLPLLIPCHRVVGSGLRLGHYSDGGAPMKRRLLEHEGVDVARLS
ncbi:MAG: methylated-DNA--[protein]-cysteine S-methyltransferase [Acidiferrobacter sp.]